MSFISSKQGSKLSISSVCVYCGSSNDVAPHFKSVASDVATALAQRGITIVYGGGHVGLMGIVADAGLKAGAKVIGIIPEHIRSKEVQHNGLTELHVVANMHTRKNMMVERSEAFVILPGGLGTLDEAFEILTWKKLKLHNKPIIIFNEGGYWDIFLALIHQTVKEGFSQLPDLGLFKVVTTVDELLAILESEAKPSATVVTSKM